ncbi:MAG: hypothetical protein QM718_11375 [Steroidobacteraceae bacterium]
MIRKLTTSLALLGALTAAVAMAAQEPDISGLYNIAGGFGPASSASLEALKPYAPQKLHGVEASAHLLPWAKARMEASSLYSAIDDQGAVCGPTGFFRHPTTVAGYMVLQIPGEVILVSEDLSQVGVRRVHLTSRHPRNIRPSWNGDSIGRWEGDTLVVDTIGFNDKSWLGSELQPHTEELHVVERIRTVKDGKFLEIQSTIDDRKALTGPYDYTRYYQRTDGSYEDNASSCNGNEGEQETWAYMRDQAISQFNLNRQAVKR